MLEHAHRFGDDDIDLYACLSHCSLHTYVCAALLASLPSELLLLSSLLLLLRLLRNTHTGTHNAIRKLSVSRRMTLPAGRENLNKLGILATLQQIRRQCGSAPTDMLVFVDVFSTFVGL